MSGLDSLYSTASSISQKVSALNVSSIVQAGIGNISTAMAAASSQLASLNILSKFQSKDLPKSLSAKDTKTPSEAMAAKSTFGGALTFPSEMKYFTKFSFFEYDKKIVTSAPKDLPTQVVILPMPNNLQESFAVQYETPALGPIVGAAADSLIKAVREKSVAEFTPDDFSGAVITAGAAGSLNALKKLSPTAGAIGSMAFGIAPNPHLAVLFSDIGLRTHSFSYKFAPTSRKELDTLKNIITQLKIRMLPGMEDGGTMLFTFPDVCDIEFGPEKGKPYNIKRCVMDNLSVNYTPMGSPAFFKTGDPVMVEINMSFKEMSVYTRSDLEAKQTSADKQQTKLSPARP
jgi:hypothetical protein